MPIYDFQAEDGEVIGVLMDMADALPLGAEYIQDGKSYRRIFSTIQKTPESRNGSAAFPRVESKQLPRRMEGNRASDDVYRGFERKGGTFNKSGQPQISSREQANEIAKSMSGDGASTTTYGEL